MKEKNNKQKKKQEGDKNEPDKGFQIMRKANDNVDVEITWTFHPRTRDAPQRMVAADIFSSSEPLIANSKIFSISAKLPSNSKA